MSLRIVPLLLALAICSQFVSAQNIGDSLPNYQQILENGMESSFQKDYKAALAQFEKVDRGDTLYADAQANAAICHFRLGELAEAEALLQNIEDQSHRFRIPLYEVRIGIPLEQGNKMDSETQLNNLEEDFPYSSHAQVVKANALLRMGSKDEALESYLKAFEMNPYELEAHWAIADLAYNSGNYALANSAAFMAVAVLKLHKELDEIHVERLNALCNLKAERKSNLEPKEQPLFNSASSWNGIDKALEAGVDESDVEQISVELDYAYYYPLAYTLIEIAANPSDAEDDVVSFYQKLVNELNQKGLVDEALTLPLAAFSDSYAQDQQMKYRSRIATFERAIVPAFEKHFEKSKRIKIDDTWKERGFNFEDGYLVSIGNYTNDVRDNDFIFFHKNQEIALRSEYSNGRNKGQFVFFNDKGNQVEQQDWASGELKGKWSKWDDRGYSNLVAFAGSRGRIDRIVGYGLNGAARYEVKLNHLGGKNITYRNGIGEVSALATGNASTTDEILRERYHANGQKIYNFRSGSRNAQYYDKYGELVCDVRMSKNKLQGKWAWYEDGKLSESGVYTKGLRNSKWRDYYTDGSVKELTSYNKGLQHGINQSFDYNGKTVMYANFKKGVPLICQAYAPDSTLIYDAKSKNKELYYKSFNNLRNCSREGLVVGENKEGEWKRYFYNGALAERNYYENGLLEGESVGYYLNGKVSEKYYLVNDTAQGYYETYFSNGQLTSSGFYENGELNGVIISYDPFGRLTLEEYMIDGVSNGITSIYYPNGKKKRDLYYEMGVVTKVVSYNTKGEEIDVFVTEKNRTDYNLMHPKGEPSLVGKLKFGYLNDTIRSYASNGTILNTYFEERGYTSGDFNSYYNTGQLREHGTYEFGDLHGLFELYNIDGSILSESQYKDGQMSGTQKLFTKSGELYREQNWYNGSSHGKTKYFSSTGELGAELMYINGTLVGYSYLDSSGEQVYKEFPANETGEVVCYYQNGNESLRFNLENGLKQGQRIISYENGQEHFISNYKDGKLEGNFLEFSPEGTPWSAKSYSEGNVDGIQKEFDSTGKLVVERLADKGYFHGPAIFYKDGEVLLEGEFVYDSFYEAK
ncbi:MAG: antitoxin component YwqK of YwqJK toxin-antitoxin module [Flavobacteriales bacterium]|jgi:antitoxin component YwqK of YwqJK toxin-antitoxin module/predicted negative regulator of RcsB-dependent stress response